MSVTNFFERLEHGSLRTGVILRVNNHPGCRLSGSMSRDPSTDP
jgi:hypothetical protein